MHAQTHTHTYIHTHNIHAVGNMGKTNEVILLIFTSVALVRKEVCSLRMIELPKHVAANQYFTVLDILS
jgi:hypothetical protein